MLRFLTVLYEKPPVAEGAAEEERAERRPGGEKTAGSGSDQEPAKKDSGPDKEPVKISGETATDSGDKEQRGDAPE
jgi:hypothetical protein